MFAVRSVWNVSGRSFSTETLGSTPGGIRGAIK
jgi:hypothetical protein